MNWQHFQAFVWLRWRIRINQLRRGGTANWLILGFLAVVAVLGSILMFVGSLVIGLFALDDVSPPVLMYVWDGLIVALLFSWATGLLADLQRSDILSLEKFLHLPVSLASAFLINYLSSLVSLTLILFVPAMVGLSLSLIYVRGPAMLLLFPLVAAFLLMVTGITHQFRNWLASLMVNPRRRRTVIVVATLVFILIFQLPNLVNVIRPWEIGTTEFAKQELEEQNQLRQASAAGKITPTEAARQRAEISRKYQERNKEAGQQMMRMVEQAARLINLVLPPGWLAFSAMALAEHNVLPALLATLMLTLIGSASLWRSYRTTLSLYTGQFTAGDPKTLAVAAAPPKIEKSSVMVSPVQKPGSGHLLEMNLPFLSEQASAVALSGFRSLTRAPEAKMLFLTPIIMVVVFGAIFWRQSEKAPIAVRPLFAYGATTMILFTLIQLVGNQFGFDRSGFRVFVLCAAPRRDILLGKNLAFAPLALTLAGVMIVMLQVIQPMRIDHLAALLPQMVSMYLLFCLVANGMSIFAPVPVAAGTMKRPNIKGVQILIQLGFVFVIPLALTPTLLPLGVEVLLDWLGALHGIPIYLLLSMIECAAVVVVYRFVLTWEGELLQAREQKILETVTTKDE